MTQDTPPKPPGRSPLQAHSLAEAHFYLMVEVCEHCGQGPLLSAAGLRRPGRRPGCALLTIQAKCSHCDKESSFLFELPYTEERASGADQHPRRINPTEEPSEILDVTQWVTLHRIVLNAAERLTDKSEARELRCDAAECLDEALRFYDADSDLPPPEALFTEQSRRRLKDRPELYIRQALIAQRQALPSLEVTAKSTMRGEGGAPGAGVAKKGRRRWWRFRT